MERFDGLVELIDGLLDAHQEPQELRQAGEIEALASEWTMSSPAFELGVALEDDRIRDFAAGFKSVDLTAPLPQRESEKGVSSCSRSSL